MLGEFVDDYKVDVIDVFAMPQSGTTVSVESVDHVFQTRMMEMLKQTGRCVAACTPIRLGSNDLQLQARDGGGLVSLASRFWLLVIER